MPLHRRVTPSIKFDGTHLNTWVERGTLRIKCPALEGPAQEHNTMPRLGLTPGPFVPASVHRPPIDATIIVSSKCLNIGEQVVAIFAMQTNNPFEAPLIVHFLMGL